VSLQGRGLVCSYGPTRALDGLDVELPQGQTLVVLGANGAGKSTLLKVLSGELTPEEGDVQFGGSVVSGKDQEWRARIGLLSHRTGLYRNLTAKENLLFFGKLHGVPLLRDRVDAALVALGAGALAEHPVSSLSRGQRQRVALARTMLHEPEVLFLDEPFTGLDRQGASVLEELLTGPLSSGRTVVMVTHNHERGLACADRVLFMDRGQRLSDDEARGHFPDELRVIFDRLTQAAV